MGSVRDIRDWWCQVRKRLALQGASPYAAIHHGSLRGKGQACNGEAFLCPCSRETHWPLSPRGQHNEVVTVRNVDSKAVDAYVGSADSYRAQHTVAG